MSLKELSWLSSFEKEEGTAACGGEVVRLFKRLFLINIKIRYSNHPTVASNGPPPPF